MLQHSGHLTFRIDPLLPTEQRRHLEGLLASFRDAETAELKDWSPATTSTLMVDFVSESSLHLLWPGAHLKICLLDRNQGLFSFGQNVQQSLADAVLDDSIDLRQLEQLIRPRLRPLLVNAEQRLNQIGLKNLKKFESRVRSAAQEMGGEGKFTSETLLKYEEALVDLEKELIQADDPAKIEKITRLFAKNHLGRTKFQYHTGSSLATLEASKSLLALPRTKGVFHAIELGWEDDGPARVIEKFFFYHTLAHFFLRQQVTSDPFFDAALWEDALDSIPFPVALLSTKAEVHQHNSLFAKLNFPPVDCLKLKLREKVVIKEIPYNVFRKDIHHLDEEKVLFVFFTESFFLKGDGNLTPSGEELGIISSSIAHELNNPIAGIQAALSLLMLDDGMGDEAIGTLKEMKNGAIRCKQLIETFLGFSQRTPAHLRVSISA